MNERNQDQNESHEDKKARLKKEIARVIDGKGLQELTDMLGHFAMGQDRDHNLMWLQAFGQKVMDAETEESSNLVKRLIAFRDELNSVFSPYNTMSGIEGKVVGKLKQSLGNVILWYSQWEKNRDYSSAINASMALGKLSTAVDLFNEIYDLGAISKLITHICSECWENIGAAAGRIVPFEQG